MSPTNRHILYFLRRTLLMASAIIVPFVVWYVCSDPFKVLYRYDEYFENPGTNKARIGINKGMVTVNTYMDNLRTDIVYNAFIFGSSISCYYNAYEWRELVGNQDSGETEINPFHFDSAGESPMSMARKIEYLDKIGAPIDYALIILDPIVMGNRELDSPFAIDPVEIHPGLQHFIKYHYTFFRASTNADYLKNLIASKITGRAANIGHNPIFESQPIIHDRFTNQESLPEWDSLISANPVQFYMDHPLLPPSHEVVASQPVITAEKRDAFNRIADILHRHNTDYQIIVSPNRRGISLSPDDLRILQGTFDPSRVHDFSTIYAADMHTDTLLYDNTHYRPPFASKMMHAVYDFPQ